MDTLAFRRNDADTEEPRNGACSTVPDSDNMPVRLKKLTKDDTVERPLVPILPTDAVATIGGKHVPSKS